MEITTTLKMGASFQTAALGLLRWVRQGFRRPDYVFGFRVVEIIDPHLLGNTVEEEKKQLSSLAKKLIIGFRNQEHARHTETRAAVKHAA